MTGQLIFRVNLFGGDIETVSKSTAYRELTSGGVKWKYRNADEMFAPVMRLPKVIQSDRFLYSTDETSLKRNALRLGIRIRNVDCPRCHDTGRTLEHLKTETKIERCSH